MLASTRPAERGPASERVYLILKEEILTCRLPPGASLNEGRLAETLSVSKTPVREALAILVYEGFVEVLPRQGYRVRELALADVQEIFQMLLLLEPAAARLAAEHASPEQLRALVEVLPRQGYRVRELALSDVQEIFQMLLLLEPAAARLAAEHASPEQLRALVELAGEPQTDQPEEFAPFVIRNRDFHVRLAEAGGNVRLADTLKHTLEELQRLYLSGLDLGTAVADHHGQHRDLIAALLKGNHHQAHDIAVRQIESSRVRVMEALFAAMSSPGGAGVNLNIESRKTRRR